MPRPPRRTGRPPPPHACPEAGRKPAQRALITGERRREDAWSQPPTCGERHAGSARGRPTHPSSANVHHRYDARPTSADESPLESEPPSAARLEALRRKRERHASACGHGSDARERKALNADTPRPEPRRMRLRCIAILVRLPGVGPERSLRGGGNSSSNETGSASSQVLATSANASRSSSHEEATKLRSSPPEDPSKRAVPRRRDAVSFDLERRCTSASSRSTMLRVEARGAMRPVVPRPSSSLKTARP